MLVAVMDAIAKLINRIPFVVNRFYCVLMQNIRVLVHLIRVTSVDCFYRMLTLLLIRVK